MSIKSEITVGLPTVVGSPFVAGVNYMNRREFVGDHIRIFLNTKFESGCHFGTDNLLRSGIYKEMGFSYDFRPYLTKYLVRDGAGIHEQYAPSVAALRRAASLPRSSRVSVCPEGF